MKTYILIAIILSIIYIIYLFRREIKWFFREIQVKLKYLNDVKRIQSKGMNKRNLTNDEIKKYIQMSKEYLGELNVDINKKFILRDDLERHLRYSRFSEKSMNELLNDVLQHMNINVQNIKLKINYISSKKGMHYAGSYSEKQYGFNEPIIVINIRNDMTMDTVISIVAHECTHHLLLSNKVRLEKVQENECLTDVSALVLGFGKFMKEGYKISNKIIYDSEFNRTINKDRVGYLSYKDVKYALRYIK